MYSVTMFDFDIGSMTSSSFFCFFFFRCPDNVETVSQDCDMERKNSESWQFWTMQQYRKYIITNDLQFVRPFWELRTAVVQQCYGKECAFFSSHSLRKEASYLEEIWLFILSEMISVFVDVTSSLWYSLYIPGQLCFPKINFSRK